MIPNKEGECRFDTEHMRRVLTKEESNDITFSKQR